MLCLRPFLKQPWSLVASKLLRGYCRHSVWGGYKLRGHYCTGNNKQRIHTSRHRSRLTTDRTTALPDLLRQSDQLSVSEALTECKSPSLEPEI